MLRFPISNRRGSVEFSFARLHDAICSVHVPAIKSFRGLCEEWLARCDLLIRFRWSFSRRWFTVRTWSRMLGEFTGKLVSPRQLRTIHFIFNGCLRYFLLNIGKISGLGLVILYFYHGGGYVYILFAPVHWRPQVRLVELLYMYFNCAEHDCVD